MVDTTKNALKFGALAKFLNVLTIVVMWILVAAAGLSLLGSIIVSLIPTERLGTYAGNTSRSFPEPTINADGTKEVAPITITTGKGIWIDLPNGEKVPLPEGAPLKPFIMNVCLFLLPNSILRALLAFCMSRILQSIVQGRPFEPGNGKALCWIALLFPIIYLVDSLLAFASIENLRHVANLKVHNRLNIHLELIILPSLLLLILSGVFRYGSELQRDTDETV